MNLEADKPRKASLKKDVVTKANEKAKKVTAEKVLEKKEAVSKESDIRNILKSFKDNVDSLKAFINVLSPITAEKDSDKAKELKKIIEDLKGHIKSRQQKLSESKNGQEEKMEGKELNKDELTAVLKQVSTLSKVSVVHTKILYQSSFVLLISYFEYLFADLLKFYFRHFPGKISDKPIQVMINELKEYDTLEEAIDFVIGREVETILFDLSFNELKDFFYKDLKIELHQDIISWDAINEMRERRHIIVHNNSLINRKYLSKSNIEYAPDKEKLTIGNKVVVGYKYYELAFNEIYLAGHILIFNCWKQWVKNDLTGVFSALLYTSFDCLKAKLSVVSNKLGKYSKTLNPENDEQADLNLRTMFNYIISLRQLEKKEEMLSELKTMRISSLSPLFKLAYYALSGEKKMILENLKACRILELLTLEDIREWPLFEHLKEDTEFYKKIEDEFVGI